MTSAFSSQPRCIFCGIVGLVLSLLLSPPGLAQSGRLKEGPPNGIPVEGQSAQALYDEAYNYVSKKYEEFNRQQLSFDPKLEAATRQEQKDLAARNAASLAARASLEEKDLYYLGM